MNGGNVNGDAADEAADGSAEATSDVEPIPDRCRVEAWNPPGIDEISEVFHAKIVDYAYPAHHHDTWTVLIVDTGAIAYDLDRRRCDAVGDTVAILPPGVTHDGQPAPGAAGFVKRVLYLDESTLPIELVGAAVDRTSIEDPALRSAIAGLHDELVLGADPMAASSALAMIAERIEQRLSGRGAADHQLDQTPGSLEVARQLRLMLDETIDTPISLDDAAQRLDRSKEHLIRSFSAQYGVAPHAYVIAKRVEAARKMLLDGVRPADAGAAVGFYDQSHFTRHFKRHTMVPPATFARSHTGPPA